MQREMRISLRQVLICLLGVIYCFSLYANSNEQRVKYVKSKQNYINALMNTGQFNQEIEPVLSGLIDNACQNPGIGKRVNNTRTWRLTEQLSEIDTTGTYQNDKKYSFFYNPSIPAIQDSIWLSVYAESFENWVPVTIYNLRWTDGGELLDQADLILNVSGNRLTFMKIFYEYDENQRLVEASVKMYDQDSDTWFKIKSVKLYYENNYLNEMHMLDGAVTNGDEYYKKFSFTRDSANRINSHTISWSADSISWNIKEQMIFTYHTNDTQTGESQTNMYSHNFPFAYLMSYPIPYGMMSEQLTQQWVSDVWTNFKRDSFNYNSQFELTEINTDKWVNGDSWQQNQKITHVYDSNSNLEEFSLKNWDNTDGEWEDSLLTHNIWEQVTAVNDEINLVLSQIDISAFPSPFMQGLELTVKSTMNKPVDVRVFNVKGQCVYKTKIMPDSKYNWSAKSPTNKELTSGVYFIKASQGRNSKAIKVLKVK